MKDWDSKGALNNSHPANVYIKRKGGRRKVKKGFATNPKLASEAGKKGMMARWHGTNDSGTDTQQEERQADS